MGEVRLKPRGTAIQSPLKDLLRLAITLVQARLQMSRRRANRPVKMLMPKKERVYMRKGLERLGLQSYRDYLQGNHWRTLRRRMVQGACFTCGSQVDLVLHHATYARLGRETTADLFTLCNGCHVAVHRDSMRTGSLTPPAGGVPAAKRFGALSVGCPTCSAQPGEFCHTLSGMPRTAEHSERRRFADARARRKSAEKQQRAAKKAARSIGLTAEQLEAIRAAREAEFPLDDLQRRIRLGR
jgi:hypothetical protein